MTSLHEYLHKIAYMRYHWLKISHSTHAIIKVQRIKKYKIMFTSWWIDWFVAASGSAVSNFPLKVSRYIFLNKCILIVGLVWVDYWIFLQWFWYFYFYFLQRMKTDRERLSIDLVTTRVCVHFKLISRLDSLQSPPKL